MSNGKNFITAEEAVRIGAAAGAKAAMETIEAERINSEEAFRSRCEEEQRAIQKYRRGRVKELLKNYHAFRANANKAVYRMENAEEQIPPLEILESLMDSRKNIEVEIESIKKSAMRTLVLTEHVDKMLDVYREHCLGSKNEIDKYRWMALDEFYLTFPRKPIEAVAEDVGASVRTAYEYIDSACDALVIYIFGVDGLSGARPRSHKSRRGRKEDA